ncbi:MAG: tetratricopeptide repeat protein [Tepidisphaeraceae bacterium]|jgi:hypothetical protein
MTFSPAAVEARRRSDAVWRAWLILIVALCFIPVGHFQFVRWDDDDLLLQNGLLHPPTFENLKLFWTGAYAGLYTPLTYSLWWLILRIRPGSGAGVYHAVDVLLHLTATGAVFSILKKCVNSAPAAFAGAAIFALHPLQIESVAWISQTNNLLAAALSLWAIRLYLESPGRRGEYLAASAIFVLAMLAKPTAVVAPILAAILDFYFLRRPIGKIARSIVPWFIAAIWFAVIARYVQPGVGGGAGAIWQRPAVAADAVAFYLRKIFWPAHLTIDYARTPARVLMDGHWIAGLVVVAILLALWKKLGRIRVGLLVMIAALLPVLGLVGFDFQRYSTVADRYMYLPMLGVALAAAIWPRAVVLLIAIPLAVQSELQMRYWRDTPALVDHTLALDPLSTIGNKILAAEYARKGQWPEAAGAYRTALIRNPDDGDLHFNLANALRGQGDYESAIAEYREAIGLLGPEYRLRAMNNLGIAYYQAGRPDLAEAEFMAIIQIDPGNAEARENMSQVVGSVPSR